MLPLIWSCLVRKCSSSSGPSRKTNQRSVNCIEIDEPIEIFKNFHYYCRTDWCKEQTCSLLDKLIRFCASSSVFSSTIRNYFRKLIWRISNNTWSFFLSFIPHSPSCWIGQFDRNRRSARLVFSIIIYLIRLMTIWMPNAFPPLHSSVRVRPLEMNIIF